MTRLPTRNGDLANQSMAMRAVQIRRRLPETGTAAEATMMADTIAYNLRTLWALPVTDLHHQFCHGCGLSSFGSQESKTHVCGYCGHGSFGPGWCADPECSNVGSVGTLPEQAAAPGPDTWWVVDHFKSDPNTHLYCGACLPLIPAFLNRYQSQLLNPNPEAWDGSACEGCTKALVIAPDPAIAQASWAGVSQPS